MRHLAAMLALATLALPHSAAAGPQKTAAQLAQEAKEAAEQQAELEGLAQRSAARANAKMPFIMNEVIKANTAEAIGSEVIMHVEFTQPSLTLTKDLHAKIKAELCAAIDQSSVLSQGGSLRLQFAPGAKPLDAIKVSIADCKA